MLPVSAFAQAPAGGGLFQLLDRDRDGAVTEAEAVEGSRRWFTSADQNHDGKVSREEAAARWRNPSDTPNRPADEGQSVGHGGVRRDIDYVGAGNPRQMLDLYLPAKPASKKLPVVVFIHGGAWRAGNKAGGARWLEPLVATGKFAGASIHYRLTDEAKWPAQIHDCKAAIRWLRGKAGELGLDPDRIAVWGSSAGGHLVSMLGTSGGVAGLEGDLGPFPKLSSRVTCVVNFFGPENFLTMVDQKSDIERRGNRYPEALLVGGDVRELAEQARDASPVTWVTPDDAPFLTAHGTEDSTVPFAQGEEIHAALGKAGVSSILIPMQGAGHGFDHPELRERILRFLSHHLLGDGPPPAGGAIRVR